MRCRLVHFVRGHFRELGPCRRFSAADAAVQVLRERTHHDSLAGERFPRMVRASGRRPAQGSAWRRPTGRVPPEHLRALRAPYGATMNDQWNRVAALAIPSGRSSISDASFFFDSPMVIDVAPGTYEIRAQCRRVSWGTIVDRVRVLRRDSLGGGAGRRGVAWPLPRPCRATLLTAGGSG